MTEDRSNRRTPPETEDDFEYLWSGARKAHAGWPVVKRLVAIFGNWKLIAVGVIVGLAMGGTEVLQAWGWIK
jgi:hypothetical protein